MILQKLKADAEAYLGEPVTEAGHYRSCILQTTASVRLPRTQAPLQA